MEILMYSDDLTKLSVDAIVNPANKVLSNGAGAALAIAKAGGHEFSYSCSVYVKEHGKLFTSQAVTLPATGQLKEKGIKYVINCVTPQRRANVPAVTYGPPLAETVFNCLREAELRGCKELAMPALGSGVHGLPMYVCNAAYMDGIATFLREFGPQRNLRTIHFVDIAPSTANNMKKSFSTYLGRPNHVGLRSRRKSSSSSRTKQSSRGRQSAATVD